MMIYPVQHITISINKPAGNVYQFASNPENFPKWVAFVKTIARSGETWFAKTDIGDLKIEWTPPNAFGIMDHHVTLENGEYVSNPMRVVPNGDGCEFTFTLFRLPGRTDREYEEDAASVLSDLKQLKDLMER